MTIRAPGTAPNPPALEASPPQTAQAVAFPEPVIQSPLGAVLAGTVGGDIIIVSAQALALLRAGLSVRAFIIRGIETMRRVVRLSATRLLIFEYGFYRVS